MECIRCQCPSTQVVVEDNVLIELRAAGGGTGRRHRDAVFSQVEALRVDESTVRRCRLTLA